MTTILVTGVGAVIGYGILRSLRQTGRSLHLIGADIYPDAVGQAWADTFLRAPLTADSRYMEWLEDTLREHQVALVMPGIEQDAHFYSEHRELFDRLGVRVVLNDKRLVALTQDKWLMHQELERIGSNLRIPSYTSGSFDALAAACGLPFLLKPKCGYASKGLLRIRSLEDFSPQAHKLGDTHMAQPIVGSDDEEYTVGVFCDRGGVVQASITLQRRLAPDGSTGKAWVRQCPDLDEAVASLCAHFKAVGPTNLQFRRTQDGWKLLEINPRISSSTSIRAAFGYNESEMCLDFYLSGKEIRQPRIRPGFAVRYIEDHIVHDRDHF